MELHCKTKGRSPPSVGISKHLAGGSDDQAHKESLCTDCLNFAALSFRSSAILCAGTEEWHLSLGDFSQVTSGRRRKKYMPPNTLPASSQYLPSDFSVASRHQLACQRLLSILPILPETKPYWCRTRMEEVVQHCKLKHVGWQKSALEA